MVKYQQPALDRTFAALADPTRRAIVARLAEQESVSVSELARPHAMSLPAVMKHLDVLSDAGLVTRVKTGRTVACRLAADPMEEARTGFPATPASGRPSSTVSPPSWRKNHARRAAAAPRRRKPSLTIQRRLNAAPATGSTQPGPNRKK